MAQPALPPRRTAIAHHLLALAWLLLPLRAGGQGIPALREQFMTWEDFVEEYIGGTQDDEETGERQTESLRMLEERYAAPLNLNTARREELLELPFLSEAQADSILAYRERKKSFASMGELLFVSNLGHADRRRLSLFTFAGDTLPATPVPIWRHFTDGRHELETRLDVPLYRRAGNKPYSREELLAEPNRVYFGNGLTHTLRYRYRRRQDVAYGLTLQKDAGEPFGRNGNYPYDYASLYIYYRALSGKLEMLLGDYNLRMGQGLLFGHDFFGGKQALVEVPPRTRTSIRKHTSTEENDFFRGGAATLRMGCWAVTLFASARRLDGTLRGDTLTAFKTDGLHRTARELERRHAIGCYTAGGHVGMEHERWRIGAGGFYTAYTKTVWPSPRTYNRHYLRGDKAAGFSLDYMWRSHRWLVQGEAAFDRLLHMATTHTVRLVCSDRLAWTLQGRLFSPRFVAPFGDAVQENSRTANEYGLLLGLKAAPFRRVEATAYADCFYFPHARFRASRPSRGMECFVQLRYVPHRPLWAGLQYRFKTKQQDIAGYAGLMEYSQTHRLRLHAAYASSRTAVHLSADATAAVRQTAATTYGWMLSARVRQSLGKRFSASAFGGVFFTDDYASRIYSYEPQLRYAAGFPVFAYHGMRLVCVCDWEIAGGLHLAARYGLLRYFNRDHIGEGTQLITSSAKSDLSVQLRWHI